MQQVKQALRGRVREKIYTPYLYVYVPRVTNTPVTPVTSVTSLILKEI